MLENPNVMCRDNSLLCSALSSENDKILLSNVLSLESRTIFIYFLGSIKIQAINPLKHIAASHNYPRT